MRHILPGMHRAARIALLCLVAAGLLSGCGTLARPFGKGKNAISGPLLEDAPPVSIVAVKGPPKRLGERIAARVTAEADRRGFEATRKPPTSRAFRMTGTLSAANTPRGVAVAYVWDLTDAIGAGRHRIAGQEVVPAFEVKDPWTAVDDDVMLRIGQYTAEGLAGFLGQRGYDVRNIALPPPPSVASRDGGATVPAAGARAAPPVAAGPRTATMAAQVAVPDVTGIDAASGRDLAAAMQQALGRNGVKLAPAADATTLKVAGHVTVGATRAGKRPVSIVWRVLDRADELVGKVDQNNEVPAAMLDGGWSPIAKLVADAASGGVMNLLVQAR
jgi:hypothetical protein